jgi:methyltransferase-like protein
VVARYEGDELVLGLPEIGQVKVLNEAGAFIWAQVDGKRSTQQIIQAVVEEYEVGQKTAEADGLNFLNELLQRGLIEI